MLDFYCPMTDCQGNEAKLTFSFIPDIAGLSNALFSCKINLLAGQMSDYEIQNPEVISEKNMAVIAGMFFRDKSGGNNLAILQERNVRAKKGRMRITSCR